MATHQFKFAVSDANLTDRQVAEVSQAIARAGSAAVAKFTPTAAIDVQIGPLVWWRGVPVDDISVPLKKFAQQQAGG
jgi:hypothetical protein